MPAHFEQASANVTRGTDQAGDSRLRPDAQPMLDKVAEFEAAGFSHVYIHQVGPDQAGFMRFAERELID